MRASAAAALIKCAACNPALAAAASSPALPPPAPSCTHRVCVPPPHPPNQQRTPWERNALAPRLTHTGCGLTLDGCHYIASMPALKARLDALLSSPGGSGPLLGDGCRRGGSADSPTSCGDQGGSGSRRELDDGHGRRSSRGRWGGGPSGGGSTAGAAPAFVGFAQAGGGLPQPYLLTQGEAQVGRQGGALVLVAECVGG